MHYVWFFYFYSMSNSYSPIGVFDSGYGGLTVLKEIVKLSPQYDYLYLGDNARAPYGPRSFETVYQYTWQCVQWFFSKGCPMVILACNTASAKALQSIQQQNLPNGFANKRVLGVIRPTTEAIGNFSQSKKIGILGTQGTVASNSYPIEIGKFFPEVQVYQQACPMWVPLVENNEYETDGADFFVKKYLAELHNQSGEIDTLMLACTHYPLLEKKIRAFAKKDITIVSQGNIVAERLQDYLLRHVNIDNNCSRGANVSFYTTDQPVDFDNHASVFYGQPIKSQHTDLSY